MLPPDIPTNRQRRSLAAVPAGDPVYGLAAVQGAGTPPPTRSWKSAASAPSSSFTGKFPEARIDAWRLRRPAGRRGLPRPRRGVRFTRPPSRASSRVGRRGSRLAPLAPDGGGTGRPGRSDLARRGQTERNRRTIDYGRLPLRASRRASLEKESLGLPRHGPSCWREVLREEVERFAETRGPALQPHGWCRTSRSWISRRPSRGLNAAEDRAKGVNAAQSSLAKFLLEDDDGDDSGRRSSPRSSRSPVISSED